MRTFKDLLSPALDWLKENERPWFELISFLQASEPELEKINFYMTRTRMSGHMSVLSFFSIRNTSLTVAYYMQLGSSNKWSYRVLENEWKDIEGSQEFVVKTIHEELHKAEYVYLGGDKL